MTQYDVIEAPFRVRIAANLYFDLKRKPLTILALGSDDKPINQAQYIAFTEALSDPCVIAVPGDVYVEKWDLGPDGETMWVFNVGTTNHPWNDEDMQLFRDALINATLGLIGDDIKKHRFIIGAE